MIHISKTDRHGRVETTLDSEDFVAERRIWILGEIGPGTVKEAVTALTHLDKVSGDDITVYINSPGGCVSDGLAILDAMKRCRSDIVTVCTGMTASMGAFLVICGGTRGKRFITPNAEIMLHQPLGGISGQATEIELAARHIVRVKNRLNTLLAEATGQTPEQIAIDTDRDCYLNAEEALRYGCVDRILDRPAQAYHNS